MTNPDDPWAYNAPQRIALARSILGHAQPADDTTKRTIDRALRALDGETIDQLRQETSH